MKHAERKAGFTLLEVLFASAVMLLGTSLLIQPAVVIHLLHEPCVLDGLRRSIGGGGSIKYLGQCNYRGNQNDDDGQA